MKTKIIIKDFEIHTTPLEKMSVSANSIEIFLDDIKENRIKITAKPYQAIKITTIDCVSSLDYKNDYCYRDGRFHRHILEIEDSSLVNELKEKTSDSSFLEKSRHFVLPLQENIVELVAYDIKLEEA